MKHLNKIFILVAFLLLSTVQTSAQIPDFSEATVEFFSTPKTYSVSSHANVMLGLDGYSTYQEGESTFTVKRNSFSYVHGDGSSGSYSFIPRLEKITVMISRGEVDMPMYVLDDESAVRAIQYEDGHYQVHHYIKNVNSGKYFHSEFFNLRR